MNPKIRAIMSDITAEINQNPKNKEVKEFIEALVSFDPFAKAVVDVVTSVAKKSIKEELEEMHALKKSVANVFKTMKEMLEKDLQEPTKPKEEPPPVKENEEDPVKNGHGTEAPKKTRIGTTGLNI